MADPDPNPNVNLAGSGVILHVQRPDGELIPVQGTDAGAIAVAGGGGGGSSEVTGPGGTLLATETTTDRTADAAEALAVTVAPGGVPVVGQDALAVVNVDPGPTFTAAPNAGTTLPAVYVAGTAPFLADRNGDMRPVTINPDTSVLVTEVGTISGQLPAELAASGGLKTELVAPLPAGTNALGSVEVTASVLPSGAATEAKQDVGNASLASVNAKTPAIGPALAAAASPVTLAIDQPPIAVSDGGGSLTVDGSVSITGTPSVSVTNFPVTQTVSGTVAVSSLPGSPAQEHVTAASPHAARLTDGTAFYKGAVAGDNLGADLRVAGAAVANGNPVPVSDAGSSLTVDTPQLPAALVGGRLSVDGSGVTQPVSGTVTSNIGTTGGLALDATLTGGTQIAIAKGPIVPGAAVGAERPVLVGGTDGTNAQTMNVDSTGAVRLQSSGVPAAAAPTRALQVGGSDGANLRAMKVDASGRPDVTVASIAAGSNTIGAVTAPGAAALALDATLTSGAQKAIARGGAKGATTAADVTSTAEGADHQALDVQVYHGGTAVNPTQIRALTAADVVSADIRVASTGVSNANPVPVSDAGGSLTIDTPQLPATLGMLAASVSISTVVARDVRRADASSYPAAGTSFLLSATPAGVRRIEWRYTGGGTKYLLLMNSASVPPAVATWTGWYMAMTNGAGKSWFEFPVPVYCSAGVALAVSATEPVAGAAIALSVAVAENFGVPFYQLQ